MACLFTIGVRDDLFKAARLLCFCIGKLTLGRAGEVDRWNCSDIVGEYFLLSADRQLTHIMI